MDDIEAVILWIVALLRGDIGVYIVIRTILRVLLDPCPVGLP